MLIQEREIEKQKNRIYDLENKQKGFENLEKLRKKIQETDDNLDNNIEKNIENSKDFNNSYNFGEPLQNLTDIVLQKLNSANKQKITFEEKIKELELKCKEYDIKNSELERNKGMLQEEIYSILFKFMLIYIV